MESSTQDVSLCNMARGHASSLGVTAHDLLLLSSTTQGQITPAANLPFLETAQAVLLRRTIYYIVNPTVLAASVISNCINIVTFATIGLSDGMSCLFMALSLSDLFHCSLMLGERISGGLQVFGKQFPYFNLLALSFIFSRHAHTWHVVSTVLTVFAAVQKCACVAFPLTFRFFFTRRRSVCVIVVIYASVVISYSPLLYIDALGPYFDSKLNRTRIGYYTRSRKLYKETADYYLFAHFTVLQFSAVCVTIGSVVLMTYKLKEAARTRQDMTAGRSKGDNQGNKRQKKNVSGNPTSGVSEKTNEAHGNDSDGQAGGNSKDTGSVFSSRELRVLRSVNIVCAIFIGGTAPYVVLTSCALFMDSFDHRGRDRTLYHIVKGAEDFWYFGSTAVNVFVYYSYNSKYKQAFDSIFKCCRKKVTGK